MIEPEWVKLIPANSIPVFCFKRYVSEADMAMIIDQLKACFGTRKFLVFRGGEVQIEAIANQQPTPSQCICGGEPHASHCPLCPDPFLRGLI